VFQNKNVETGEVVAECRLSVNVRIVLVEPEGELNVGAVARVMKNFEFNRLIIVNPQCDTLSHDAQKMAVHAKEVLHNAETVDSLKEALKGCVYAVATTSKKRMLSEPLKVPADVFPALIQRKEEVAVIFGPESRGLNNEELNWAQKWVCIPTGEQYPVLNLAQAVSICCYEMYKAYELQAKKEKGQTVELNKSPASLTQINHYLEHLSGFLSQIGFLHPHTVLDRMSKIRRLLLRSQPSIRELAMLRGMTSQTQWARNQMIKSKDSTERNDAKA